MYVSVLKRIPNDKTEAGSIIKETVSSSPVKLYKLSDFKGLTYRVNTCTYVATGQ